METSKNLNRRKPSLDEFICLANKVHNNKYEYSSVQYKNNHTKISVICPHHGTFSTEPRNHIHRKTGCPTCGNTRKGSYHKSNNTDFVLKANKIHSNRYDYSLIEYKNIHTKVKINCSIHGTYEQTPAAHLHQKQGCPKCSYVNNEGGYGKKRFQNHPEIKVLPALLYLIEVTDGVETFIKIGITRKTIQDRFHKNNTIPYKYSINTTKKGTLFALFELEQTIKKQFKGFKYRPTKHFNGHTECFQMEAKEHIIGFLNE